MRDLPFLLKLLDDPSPSVRARVSQKVRELGEAIWPEIEAQNLTLSASQRALLDEILMPDARETLVQSWRFLQNTGDELAYLESALLLLGGWQSGDGAPLRAAQTLDDLAQEFLNLEPNPDSIALARFLFEHHGLHGAPVDDYYNPLHSNLDYALQKRAGLPITLACVFILVGHRVGLRIEGCSFPGHFLARDARRGLVFDPYNGGRILGAPEVATLQKAAPLEMQTRATSREIIARVLRNLSMAYHHQGQDEESGFMLLLLREIEGD